MSFQPLHLFRSRNEVVVNEDEARDVELISKDNKAKVYLYPYYNRPVVGYIIGNCTAQIYPNTKQKQFVYAKLGSTWGWIDLGSVTVVNASVTKVDGNYKIEWLTKEESDVERWGDNGGPLGDNTEKTEEIKTVKTRKPRKTESTN
jgi:hypothetical protein